MLIVFSTFPDAAAARKAADTLLEERLAACVSILPGLTSVYRWQGSIEETGEILLMIKTTHANYSRLESSLKACHPYELPEIVAIGAESVLPDYLAWVERETAPDIHK